MHHSEKNLRSRKLLEVANIKCTDTRKVDTLMNTLCKNSVTLHYMYYHTYV